ELDSIRHYQPPRAPVEPDARVHSRRSSASGRPRPAPSSRFCSTRPDSACQNGATMERPQVLIIDDETGSRESMAMAIEKAGLPVRTFDDARRALEFLEANPGPNLALCDLRMPGMDGIEFLQQVRGRNYDLGVVLITAFGSI